MRYAVESDHAELKWKGFVQRNNNTLIDPSVPQRTVSNIGFPNQNHLATQPLIAGSLERKSRAALKGYSTNYYVVTRSKYLHEFKDDSDFKKDPTPELSLYLPDCTVGGITGATFSVKGKDSSKGKVGSALAMSHELNFRAHTPSDAEKWWGIIRNAAGEATFTSSTPSSPTDSKAGSGQQMPPPRHQQQQQPAPLQTHNVPRTGTQSSAGTSQSAGDIPISGGAGKPHMNTPTSASAGLKSGVDRAPGQY